MSEKTKMKNSLRRIRRVRSTKFEIVIDRKIEN